MNRNNWALKAGSFIARLIAACDHQRESNRPGARPPERRAKSSPIARIRGSSRVGSSVIGSSCAIHNVSLQYTPQGNT